LNWLFQHCWCVLTTSCPLKYMIYLLTSRT
jgi:hypothetical protein